MLDVFVEGVVERMSPEAPVPILAEQTSVCTPGGAANAALRARDLGSDVSLFGRLGKDDAAKEVLDSLAAAAVKTQGVYRDPQITTTRKTRFLSAGRQLLRVDKEERRPASAPEITFYREGIASAPVAILVSDYGKGVVSDELLELVRARAGEVSGFFVVDPAAGIDPGRYRGAALITPNRRECELIAGTQIVDAASAKLAALAYSGAAGDAPVLVTLGAEGALLIAPGRSGSQGHVFFAAYRQDVFDVTGAGDATAAAIARGLSGGLDLSSSCRLGMAAGAVAVSRPHTTAISLAELADL